MGWCAQLPGTQSHAQHEGRRPGFLLSLAEGKRDRRIVEVIAESHPPDSTTDDDRWDCVDIKAVRTLPKPVALSMCKEDPRLAEMVLVNNSRLSVQPVTEAEWQVVLELAGDKG